MEKEVNKLFDALLNDVGKRNLNLAHLKYQCSDHIKPGQMEKIKTSFELFEALNEHDVINPNNLSFLHELLLTLGHEELLTLLKEYQDKVTSLQNSSLNDVRNVKTVAQGPQVEVDNLAQPFGGEQSDISRAVYYVGSKITSNWQSLARFLRIPNHVIEDNLQNHPRDIRSTIHATMSWWERQGTNITKETLISALREIRRNDLADDLQYNLY